MHRKGVYVNAAFIRACSPKWLRLKSSIITWYFVPNGAALTAGKTLRPQFRPRDYTPALHFLPPPKPICVYHSQVFMCYQSVFVSWTFLNKAAKTQALFICSWFNCVSKWCFREHAARVRVGVPKCNLARGTKDVQIMHSPPFELLSAVDDCTIKRNPA